MTNQTNVPIQNFSVPADTDQDIYFTVATSISGDTLDGNDIYWRVFEQEFGVPVVGVDPVIQKSTVAETIDILSPPMTFRVKLVGADTVLLLRNYYHEALVVDNYGNKNPVACGIMTVTATENRV